MRSQRLKTTLSFNKLYVTSSEVYALPSFLVLLEGGIEELGSLLLVLPMVLGVGSVITVIAVLALGRSSRNERLSCARLATWAHATTARNWSGKMGGS